MEKKHIDLIFCAGGNKRLAEIAIKNGFRFGSQLPSTNYFPIYFADQDWKNPKKDAYLLEIRRLRPKIATVLDLEFDYQVDEVLSWAEDISKVVEVVIIIPKFSGAISLLPKKINGKEVRLGYSVPTKFGGTNVSIDEFIDFPVHLLGGSPHKQLNLFNKMNVKSVDGNMSAKMATRFCAFWTNGDATYAKNRYWPQLKEADGYNFGFGAVYEAFDRSCKNIINAWRNVAIVNEYDCIDT